MPALQLTQAGQIVAGTTLLSIVTIEVGGWFMTRIARGAVPMTGFQKSFARAGHGHAGALVTLGLICVLLTDATDLGGPAGWVARLGVPLAAVLMSAGFFAASAGRDRQEASRWIAVLAIGAVCLAAGVVTLGIGLLL